MYYVVFNDGGILRYVGYADKEMFKEDKDLVFLGNVEVEGVTKEKAIELCKTTKEEKCTM